MKSFHTFLTEDRASDLIGRNMDSKMRYQRALAQGTGPQFLDDLEAQQAVYEKVKAVWKANYTMLVQRPQ